MYSQSRKLVLGCFHHPQKESYILLLAACHFLVLLFHQCEHLFYFFVFNHVIISQAFKDGSVKQPDCSVKMISDSRQCHRPGGRFSGKQSSHGISHENQFLMLYARLHDSSLLCTFMRMRLFVAHSYPITKAEMSLTSIHWTHHGLLSEGFLFFWSW